MEKSETSHEKTNIDINADIIIYSGDIDYTGASRLIDITQDPDNENVLFILCTPGGDAHAAFKIARRLQNKYKKFSLYVNGYCKSAGTLIAIGSDEIIMSDHAEFGPLDVQLQERDEIGRYSSGLNLDEALRIFKVDTVELFKATLVDLIADTGISTKIAAELANNLAIGFINPITSQIDPIRVGEIQRAVKIAMAYGERLISSRGNLESTNELARLVQGYPDHGFVIDFPEASEIFKNVRASSESEELIATALGKETKIPSRMKQRIERLQTKETENEKSDQPSSAKSAGENKERAAKPDKKDKGRVVSIDPQKESA